MQQLKLYLLIAFIFPFISLADTETDPDSSFEEKHLQIKKLQGLISENIHIRPDTTLKYINEGIKLADQLNSQKKRVWFISNKGLLYLYQGYHKKATTLLFEALELYKQMGNLRDMATTYSNIAIAERDGLSKLYYLRKALDVYRKANDISGTARTYINIGTLDILDPDSSLAYFKKALKLGKKTQDSIVQAAAITNIILANYSEATYVPDTVFDELRMALKMYWLKEYGWGISQNQMVLAQLFYNNGEPDSSLKYIREIIKLTENSFSEINQKAYVLLIKIKKEQKEFEKALYYQQKLDSINDFASENNNKNLASLLEMEYQSRLEQEEIEKLNMEIVNSRNKRVFLISLLALLSLSGIIIFSLQRDRIRKKNDLIKQNQLNSEIKLKLADSELHRAKMEKEHLNEKLNFTNRGLAEFASNIIQKSELLKDVQHRVESIKTESADKVDLLKKQLNDLSVMLAQMNNSEGNHRNIYEKAENFNHDLLFEIQKKFPQLTEGDAHLLILIMLKFNSKEIASMYNIELNSVNIKRHRLRRKLGITRKDSFESFIAKHLPGLNLNKTDLV